MSFNTRQGNTAESPAASAIPGAFPTDDVSGNNAGAGVASGDYLDQSGSQRNKLHKPNDPRGWDTSNTSSTQQHSASGLPESNFGSGAQGSNYQTSQLSRNNPESSNDRYSELAGAPTAGVGGAGQFQRQESQPIGGSDRNLSSGEAVSGGYSGLSTGTGSGVGSSTSALDQQAKNTTAEDPYWGDLPRGAGVYNTVIGHGSTEDSQAHHDAHSQPGQLGAKSSTAADSSYDSTGKREFPLTGSTGSTGYAQGTGDNRQQTRDINDQSEDNRRKGLYEAGGVAAVGAAAYPIAHDREQEKHDKRADKAEKAREAEQPKEHKESKIHALLHRDKSEKDEKPTKTEKPKEKKEHTHHEQKYTDTYVPATTGRTREDQPQAQDYSRNTDPSQYRDSRQGDVDSRDSRVKEGLGLGAAGAAAYGATKYAEKEHNKPEGSSAAISSNNPSGYQQTGDYSANTQRGTHTSGGGAADDSKYKTLASGTPSGIKQEGDTASNAATTSSTYGDQSSSHKARDGAIASAAVLGTQYDNKPSHSASDYTTREADPVERRGQETTSQSAYNTRDTNYTEKYGQEYPHQWAANTREADPVERREQQYTSGSAYDSRETKPVDRAEQQYKSHNTEETPRESRNTEAAALGAGAAATGAAALAYKSHASPSERAETTHHSTTTPGHKKPAPSSSENDQYNHLASGTPSGINIEHE